MATRLSHRTSSAREAPEHREKYPELTAQEWREAYEWYVEINRRIADGSIHDTPPVEVQLADHVERLGIRDRLK